MIRRRILEAWVDVCDELGDRCELAARSLPPGVQKDPFFSDLLDEMFAFAAVPNRTTWSKALPVLCSTGSRIAAHRHPEHTVLFYVDPGDPPAAIIVEGERIEPEPGLALYLAPGVEHEVEKNAGKRRRISIAMLI